MKKGFILVLMLVIVIILGGCGKNKGGGNVPLPENTVARDDAFNKMLEYQQKFGKDLVEKNPKLRLDKGKDYKGVKVFEGETLEYSYVLSKVGSNKIETKSTRLKESSLKLSRSLVELEGEIEFLSDGKVKAVITNKTTGKRETIPYSSTKEFLSGLDRLNKVGVDSQKK